MMDSRLIERTPFNAHFPNPGDARVPGNHLWYRIQMIAATTFLLAGITGISVGLPSLAQDVATARLKVSGAIDLVHMKFSENIDLEVDSSDIKKNMILSVVGICSVLLSTGILFGMALQR